MQYQLYRCVYTIYYYTVYIVLLQLISLKCHPSAHQGTACIARYSISDGSYKKHHNNCTGKRSVWGTGERGVKK